MDSVTESAEDRPAMPAIERPADLEAVLMGAVEQARAAIIEHSGDTVGEYLGATFDDSNAATHRFLANMPGYQGWQWAVVVAAHPGADHATISEVVLVPGPTALLAPKWVPWQERVQPGDLGPGDLLAPRRRGSPPGARLLPRPEIPTSTRSPSSWGWAAAGCSASWVAPTPRSAGMTASTGRARRWPGPPVGCAGTAASICRCAGRWD